MLFLHIQTKTNNKQLLLYDAATPRSRAGTPAASYNNSFSIAGYVYYPSDKKWKWRIIGNSKKKKQKGGYNIGNEIKFKNTHKTGLKLLEAIFNDPKTATFFKT